MNITRNDKAVKIVKFSEVKPGQIFYQKSHGPKHCYLKLGNWHGEYPKLNGDDVDVIGLEDAMPYTIFKDFGGPLVIIEDPVTIQTE